MSSPFSILRKYQKSLLVVFGVVAMITFTIGGIVTRHQERSMSQGYQQAVVTWKQGSISEADLHSMRSLHAMAVRFMDALMKETQDRKGFPKGMGIPRSNAEQDLVRTELLAEKARQLGIVVNDDAVIEYLDQMSDDKIKNRSEYGRILRDATQGQLGQSLLFDQLRKELLALRMQMLATSGLAALTPHDAWGYFNRLNRRVTAEVLPLRVADFTDRVKGSPSDAEIQRMYQEGKERFKDPNSPDAGFKRRRRIAFQYVKAEFEELLKKQQEKITDAEVQKYYDEHLSDFKAPDLPPAEEKKDASKEEAKPEAKPAAKTDVKGPDSKTTSPSPETKPEAKPETKSEAKPEAKTETKPEVKPEAKPAAKVETKPEAKAETKPEAKPEAKPDAKPAVGETPKTPEAKKPDGARAAAKQDVFFISTVVADESGAAKEKAKDESQPAVPSAAEKPATEKPAAPPVTTPTEKATTDKTKPSEAPAGKEPAAAKEPAAEKPVTYKPLSEVADQIRRTLATPLAQKQLKESLTAIKREADEYFREHAKWVAQSKSDSTLKEPTFDYEGLAKQHGLTSGKTKLEDELHIVNYDLGKAYRFSIAQNQIQTIPFAAVAYAEGLPLFKADLFPERDLEQRSFFTDVEYLYWKVEEKEPYVPELQEIEAEAIDAWKLTQALGIAQDEAKSLAKKVKQGKPLKDSVDATRASQVVQTNAFTWITYGSTPMGGSGQPRLSVVDNVEAPGREFMEAVFALKLGETGVAVNRPQTVVYVVRIASETPDEAKRRQDFLEAGVTRPVTDLAGMDRYLILEDWMAELEKEMKVKWNRPPVQFTSSDF